MPSATRFGTDEASMKKLLFAAILGGAIAGISGTASARDSVSLSINAGTPYYGPAVVTAPAYYPPQQVYVGPSWQERRYWEERREAAWREHERREHWRWEHERRERAWREHEWREHHGW
jgi:hypothetical protein